MRSEKELLVATRPFAQEQRWLSWWHLWSTLTLLLALLTVAAAELPWWVRLPASIFGGLLFVRFFILFHDQQHGSILRGSRVASVVMWLFGILTLNPISVWRRSHDHHHRHNSKEFNPNIGSFPLMSVDGYDKASFWEKFLYGATRHPVTIALGYITVFGGSMCILPLIRNPRRHWDAAVSLVAHVAFAAFMFRTLDDLLLAWILPFLIGSGLGSYLFFAQHNFPGVKLQTESKWDYVFSALHSSSYTKMNPVMAWFTGNIGYHHVHHLNAKIPFYRLPEAMAAIEELRMPTVTTLAPWDVLACLRLKLWDQSTQQLVGWPPATAKPRLVPASHVPAPHVRPAVPEAMVSKVSLTSK